MNTREIVEALIFSTSGTLGIKEILEAVPDLSVEGLDHLVEELNALYNQTGRSFLIERVSQGYMFVTRQEFTPYIKTLHEPARLSNAAMEVLAVIAYKGPCTKQTIEGIRGVDSSSSLKSLLKHQLIDIKSGRPMMYSTTNRFLEVFALKSLADLPDISQYEEVFREEQ
ncbi:MAG TPA: SMC-Scp complex subunit ScpB [Deltaproteobacteria bacterium]|nr:SMC-Scp complex subunit ScpB [Deltaproteobacteria bacterium]